jgi:IS5 family transposase
MITKLREVYEPFYGTFPRASKHYCRRTNYRVQTHKTTAWIDTEVHAFIDVHYTTKKRHHPARLAGHPA